jgi:hypothetical protein
LKAKTQARKEVNLLELIPIRNIEWEKSVEGTVILLKPKFQHPFLMARVLPKLKRPYYQVKLDEVGSFFWESCDGKKTIRDIAEEMKNHFGEKIEPTYERLSLFLQSLEKNKFIRFGGLLD